MVVVSTTATAVTTTAAARGCFTAGASLWISPVTATQGAQLRTPRVKEGAEKYARG